MGPASDDVGWLNAGADIVVHGHATNGCGNAMSQGRICVAGDIGARGMTMTKHNPRFAAPQLWVLGGTGDSFAEFMAGGIAVVCGHEPLHADNVLGHRPCVGMVGGKIFFRGPCKGYSEEDARIEEVAGDEWKWLTSNMRDFLQSIGRSELFDTLMADRRAWNLLVARNPGRKAPGPSARCRTSTGLSGTGNSERAGSSAISPTWTAVPSRLSRRGSCGVTSPSGKT